MRTEIESEAELRFIVLEDARRFGSGAPALAPIRYLLDGGTIGASHGVALASGWASYSTRARSMSVRCSRAHSATPSSGGRRVVPSAVNEYSTRGGTTGNTSRSTIETVVPRSLVEACR